MIPNANRVTPQEGLPTGLKIYLTPMEAASLLGLGRTSIYKLVNSNLFPVVRVGKSIRIPREPFVLWANRQSGQLIQHSKHKVRTPPLRASNPKNPKRTFKAD